VSCVFCLFCFILQICCLVVRLSTLSDDFCSEDECSFLAIVIGRAFTQPFAKVIKNRVDRISSFSASQRAAYYSLLECVPVKPFVLVESILHFEIKAWNKDHSLLLWPVFRSCCKLIESCAFSCVEMRQFDVSFEFLVFVLSERAMNVVCRVHAALAMRGALCSWAANDFKCVFNSFPANQTQD
jgi:hypothetical protein